VRNYEEESDENGKRGGKERAKEGAWQLETKEPRKKGGVKVRPQERGPKATKKKLRQGRK